MVRMPRSEGLQSIIADNTNVVLVYGDDGCDDDERIEMCISDTTFW